MCGIDQSPAPGTEPGYPYIPAPLYHRRYVAIQSQLQVAASPPPPRDYSWHGTGADTAAVLYLAQTPVIAYPPLAPMAMGQPPPPMTAPLAPMAGQAPGAVGDALVAQAPGVVQPVKPAQVQPVRIQTIVPVVGPVGVVASQPPAGIVIPAVALVYATAYAKPLPVAVGRPVVAPPPLVQGFPVVQPQTHAYQVPPQQVQAHQRRYNKRREQQARQEERERRRNNDQSSGHYSSDYYYMYGGYYGYRSTHYDYHGYESYCGHYHDADMRERSLEDRNFLEPMDDSYVDAGAVPDHGIGEGGGRPTSTHSMQPTCSVTRHRTGSMPRTTRGGSTRRP